MPNSDPQGRFFYPTLTLMIDSYNTQQQACLSIHCLPMRKCFQFTERPTLLDCLKELTFSLQSVQCTVKSVSRATPLSGETVHLPYTGLSFTTKLLLASPFSPVSERNKLSLSVSTVKSVSRATPLSGETVHLPYTGLSFTTKLLLASPLSPVSERNKLSLSVSTMYSEVSI